MKRILLATLMLGAAAGVRPAAGGANEGFVRFCAERAAEAAAADAAVVRGRNGWLFLPGALRFLGAGPFWGEAAVKVGRARKPDRRDPLPAILDFQRQLEAEKIPLLLVPVPPKALIYPDELGYEAAEARVPAVEEFYRLLREKGVDVLDLAPVLRTARGEGERPLYCLRDTHWSGRGIEIAAARIAEWLETNAGIRRVSPPPAGEERAVRITGDLQRMAEDPSMPPEEVVLTFRSGDEEGASVDPASPVLLLGDSHVLIFHAGGDMLAVGAGLPDRLSAAIGSPVDLLGVRGSGATAARIALARRVRKDPGAIRGKRAVIWCFTAREFTEADGWARVPVLPR